MNGINHRPGAFRWYLLLVITFAAGFVLGRRVADANERTQALARKETKFSAPTPAPATREPTPAPAITALEAAAPESAKEPSYRTRLRALIEANELLHSRISIPMFSSFVWPHREPLNDEFVKIFELSPWEVQRLTDESENIKKQLTEIEARHATIERTGEGRFTISIPSYPTEGGAVYDQFQATIRAVLGGERYAYYNKLSRSSSDSSFGGFGLSRTIIHIDPTLTQGDGGGRFDPATGTSVLEHNMPTGFFKADYPVLYQKMVDAGDFEQKK